MSIKISFMHYMKWTRVMLLVVFEEFKVVYIFFATFFFSLSLSIVKGLAKIFSKNLGRLQPPPLPPSPPGFYRPVLSKYTQQYMQVQ